MKLKFWGTRGSIATPGTDTIKYGGNTSCIQVVSDNNHQLIFDMGTGLRQLGMELNKSENPLNINILLSHTHSDHINGFPFFEPAYRKGNNINIYGPAHFEKTLAEVMTTQMDYSFFPIRTAQLAANINYIDLKDKKIVIDGFEVETCSMNHPIRALGYKVRADGKTLIYTGDTEPYYNLFGDDSIDDDADSIIEEENKRMVDFIRDVDCLICDTQYTEEEYKTKKGWGHSYVEYNIKISTEANVKKLIFFHHDPQHKDEDVDQMVLLGQKLLSSMPNSKLKIMAAEENMEVVVE